MTESRGHDKQWHEETLPPLPRSSPWGHGRLPDGAEEVLPREVPEWQQLPGQEQASEADVRRMGVPLEPGSDAPDFRARAIGGKYGAGQEVSLRDFAGRALVLYFYPKDDTPGCTAQACALRDGWADFEGKAEIFGVSVDSPKSHEKFIAKFGLPFPLLSDETHALVEAYGVWVEKSMYGKKYMGAERSRFVIGPEGKIRQILRKVKPEEHARQLLESLA